MERTIYQIILDGEEGFTHHIEAAMKRKVEWYKEHYPEKNPHYKKIKVDRNDLGLCFNTPEHITPKWEEQCSVGLVRVLRSGTRDGVEDTGTCFSCPKWIPMEKLDDIYSEQRVKSHRFKDIISELGKAEGKVNEEHTRRD